MIVIYTFLYFFFTSYLFLNNPIILKEGNEEMYYVLRPPQEKSLPLKLENS